MTGKKSNNLLLRIISTFTELDEYFFLQNKTSLEAVYDVDLFVVIITGDKQQQTGAFILMYLAIVVPIMYQIWGVYYCLCK